MLGDGPGGFRAKTDFPTGATAFTVISADFDGDDKPDLASANIGPDSISVLLNSTGR